jgi:sarcosine oxidase
MIDCEKSYDVAVIGAGMMGASAARHLAKMGATVALIGSPEPDEKSSHDGVFASHYDQARITRKLDRNGDWSRLSQASIERYSEVEKQGDQTFFSPVGSIMVGPEAGPGCDFIQNARRTGLSRNIEFEELRGDALATRFPYFDFPDGVLALSEVGTGGWINPRHHVKAQVSAAQKLGVSVYRQEALNVAETSGHVVVTCADGTTVTAAKTLVSCGAFSKAGGLLPDPLPMKVYARTITYFELPESEVLRLATMPSVVYVPPDLSCDPYILPPVKYADGKTYIKIGGDPQDVELETIDDIKDWFRGRGDESVGAFLRDQLLKVMPDLTFISVSYGSCVTSFTPSRKPLIYPQTNRVIALTGGNGAGAKCGDELGRLGAKLALDGDISAEGYVTDFRP